MEFLLFLLIIPILFAGHKYLYQPFENGTFKIDHLKHPMLHRTQRILRARNVEEREREQSELKHRRFIDDSKMLLALEKERRATLSKTQGKHIELTSFWDGMFKEVTREEDERKHKEQLAIRVAKEKAEYKEREEIRRRERVIWEANEQKRLKAFKEQRAREIAQEYEERKNRIASNLRERAELEAMYAAKQNVSWEPLVSGKQLARAGGLAAPKETRYDVAGSYGDRVVNVHGVYLRSNPDKSSKILGNMSQYEKVTVDGWTIGEELYGIPIWFHLSVNGRGANQYPGWIWGGSLNNQSTSGLKRIDLINEDDYDTETIRSIDGTVHRTISTKRSDYGQFLDAGVITASHISTGNLQTDPLLNLSFNQPPELTSEQVAIETTRSLFSDYQPFGHSGY